MPFGKKPDPAGGPEIDFDRIYENALAPAIEAASMEGIRADEERTGGIIHKPMFERLMLCDYAIADLTTANANVFYELGVRHTARPRTTLTLFARQQRIPFDVNYLRSLPYDLGPGHVFGEEEARALREATTKRLAELRELGVDGAAIDSPVFQLLTDWQPGEIARLRTDVFRERVQANEALKRRLAAIRAKHRKEETREDAGADLLAFRGELGALDMVEAATVVDLMLTYRAVEDWTGMIELYEEMPEELRRQVLVREQLSFAHNRRAGERDDLTDRDEALHILHEIEREKGPSSETLGLLGRIHKDQWQDADDADDPAAPGHLANAIDAYRRGYLADHRDAYPGVNLLTLLEIEGSPASLDEKRHLLPVVHFAVERRLSCPTADYWDHATAIEVAVLERDEAAARKQLGLALGKVRETWEPRSTAGNLAMIASVRRKRKEPTDWLNEIAAKLHSRGTG